MQHLPEASGSSILALPTIEKYELMVALGQAGLQNINALHSAFNEEELAATAVMISHVSIDKLYSTFGPFTIVERNDPRNCYTEEELTEFYREAGAQSVDEMIQWYSLFKRLRSHIPYTPFRQIEAEFDDSVRFDEAFENKPKTEEEYRQRVGLAFEALQVHVETHRFGDNDLEASRCLLTFLDQNFIDGISWDLHMPENKALERKSTIFSILTAKPDKVDFQMKYLLLDSRIIPLLEAQTVLQRALRVLEDSGYRIDSDLIDRGPFAQTSGGEMKQLGDVLFDALVPEGPERDAFVQKQIDSARRILKAVNEHGLRGYLELALNAGRDRYVELFSPTAEQVAGYNRSMQVILQAYE